MAKACVSAAYIDDALFAEILEHITSGLSVGSFFITHEKTERSFYNWLDKHATESHIQAYLRARKAQADAIFDECLDIADNATDDVELITTERGDKLAIKHSAIQRAKLQIDTRMRMAGKLKPKKYGDKLVQEHTGSDGAPIEIAMSDSLRKAIDKDLDDSL